MPDQIFSNRAGRSSCCIAWRMYFWLMNFEPGAWGAVEARVSDKVAGPQEDVVARASSAAAALVVLRGRDVAESPWRPNARS